MKDVGLYRIAPGGEIRKSYYDYQTKTIGPYTFEAPIAYIDKYHIEKAEPSLDHLYEAILGNTDALCVFFTNNDYVAIVTKNTIVYANIYDKRDVIPYKFKEPLYVVDSVPVGYVKTRPECVSIATLPYKLFYSELLCSVYFEGKWMPIKDKPMINPPIKFYARLLEHEEAEAVYVNSDGREIFITGGEK